MLSAIWTPLRDASAALIQFSPPAETLRRIGAVLFLTLSLWQVMPSGVLPGRSRRLFVIVSGLLGLGLLWWSIPAIGSLSARSWLLGPGGVDGVIGGRHDFVAEPGLQCRLVRPVLARDGRVIFSAGSSVSGSCDGGRVRGRDRRDVLVRLDVRSARGPRVLRPN